MKIELKGLHGPIRTKGREYWYAWRGGPRVEGEPGTPAFIANFNRLHAERSGSHGATGHTKFRSIVVAFKTSPKSKWTRPADEKGYSNGTKREWLPWLDRITDFFGDTSIAAFNNTLKIKEVIVDWQAQWASTPRKADMGMQVLSVVCTFGVDKLFKIRVNPCIGLEKLYAGGNRADVIWTDEDIVAFKEAAPGYVANALELAALTGLRKEDLIRLGWSHVETAYRTHEIRIATLKSNLKLEAVIPLYDELRALLARIPRVATTVLANSKEQPFTENALSAAF